MKKILQIKYCYTEQETNKFLKSLDLYKEGASLEICDAQGYFKKHLSGITYFPRVQGEGNADKSSVSSDVLSVIQYFTYTCDDEK